MGEKPEKVSFGTIDSEEKLEDMLAADLSMLSPSLMFIGRQIRTEYGSFIDMLAIDSDGNLTIIELKRNKTPREVVAQLLDYASWIQTLSYGDIATIYSEKNQGQEFEKGFAERFDTNPPEELNEKHSLIVVAAELDNSSERIINYLSDNYYVPINAVFFRYFQDGGQEYLTRTWLVDPQEAEAKTSRAASSRGTEPWNGRDFYVALGEDDRRNWEDCRRYGFVSAGGGRKYSGRLYSLNPGARVFVHIPQKGYVGVGTVITSAVPVTEFKVNVNGITKPILEAPLKATNMADQSDNPDLSEHCVGVSWIKAVPREESYWEMGLFANQQTACMLRNRFTIERLTKHFELKD